MHKIRIKHQDRIKLKRHVISLTAIARVIHDLDSRDKIERAVALLIQVLITATFRPNQKDLLGDD